MIAVTLTAMTLALAAAAALVVWTLCRRERPVTARRRAADARTGAISATEIRRHLDAGTLPADLSTLTARKPSGRVTRTPAEARQGAPWTLILAHLRKASR